MTVAPRQSAGPGTARAGRRKLTNAQVAELRAWLIASGESREAIAERFGIAPSYVTKLATGQARADVEPCATTLARLRAEKAS